MPPTEAIGENFEKSLEPGGGSDNGAGLDMLPGSGPGGGNPDHLLQPLAAVGIVGLVIAYSTLPVHIAHIEKGLGVIFVMGRGPHLFPTDPAIMVGIDVPAQGVKIALGLRLGLLAGAGTTADQQSQKQGQ
jgi:hypothetical protein